MAGGFLFYLKLNNMSFTKKQNTIGVKKGKGKKFEVVLVIIRSVGDIILITLKFIENYIF